ncbi:unnamed protein product [Owenia fusiformis]|uniref:Uncharacterized protein n=1 Tax=Owenia fusiformis TaxID=6347 RepID=A0A8S4N2X4_OWEFU|nr:unnamed protein product [Owenia fusiformis]
MMLFSVCVALATLQLALSQAPACSQNITDNDIILLESPGYPNNYPAQSQCLYRILFTQPRGTQKVVRMYVSNFRLYNQRFSRDMFRLNNRIYYGDGSSEPTALQIGRTYTFRTYDDEFVMALDARTTTPTQGFALEIFIEPGDGSNNKTEECDGRSCSNGRCHSYDVVEPGPGYTCLCSLGSSGPNCELGPNTHDCPKYYEGREGVITSTNYPGTYPDSHLCDMLIMGLKPGEFVTLFVEEFRTERNYDFLYTQTQSERYHGNGRSDTSAMQIGQTYIYEVVGDTFRLHFSTDGDTNFIGFRLLYNVFGESERENFTSNPEVGNTNKGTTFSIAFLTQPEFSTTGETEIFITSEAVASVEVYSPFTGDTMNFTLIPETFVRVDMPNFIRLINGTENKGIRIRSDVNITVSGFNTITDGADSFLALPHALLGTQYIVPCYAPFSIYDSTIAVVATADDTTVWFARKVGQDYDYDNALEVRLNDLQTYLYAAESDLTGTIVYSNRPVAVFSGAEYTQVPANVNYFGHLEEQIPPVQTWGYDHVVVPVPGRYGGDIIRVIAAEDGTIVSQPNGFTQTLVQGGFAEFDIPSDIAHFIKCSRRCMVVQYNKGRLADNNQGGSGPFMSIVPSVSQFVQSDQFQAPDTFDDKEYTNYVSVVVNKDKTVGMLFNGENITETGAVWRDVPGSDYAFTSFNAGAMTNSIRHTDVNVKHLAMLSGHCSTNGYGYPLGMSLDNIAAKVTDAPKTTPSPTLPTQNGTEICYCKFRIENNETAGEEELGRVLHDFPNRVEQAPAGCETCWDLLRQCPRDCKSDARAFWGSGLFNVVVVEGRDKTLGQLFCERHFYPILPPGRRINTFYQAGACDLEMATFVPDITGDRLCCSDTNVPVIGRVPVWDVDCTGQNSTMHSTSLANVVQSAKVAYKKMGLDSVTINKHVKTIHKQTKVIH